MYILRSVFVISGSSLYPGLVIERFTYVSVLFGRSRDLGTRIPHDRFEVDAVCNFKPLLFRYPSHPPPMSHSYCMWKV